jgi:hypothetical protein
MARRDQPKNVRQLTGLTGELVINLRLETPRAVLAAASDRH